MLHILRKQPPELVRAAKRAGVSCKDISGSQLLLVSGGASKAVLRCYEKNKNGIWRFVGKIGAVGAHVGKNGITFVKKEGDGCTPSGYFSLGHAFGCREKPDTKMMYRHVTKNSFWVDDPKSNIYNSWVEGTDTRDWSNAERLSDYPDSYAYAVVIEYNTLNVSPGKGSAIFLHCGSRPTSGCIAVSANDILKILRWLHPDKTPGILICKPAQTLAAEITSE